jgi:DNA invertase Pin-like site-specific DNA recombinase
MAAMMRVLSGQPKLAEPGDLTITAVATEAQLKRHHLTHKHTDLKDLFYRLRDQHGNPASEHKAATAAEAADLKSKLAEAREDARKWKSTAQTFARAINVLTIENKQLADQPENILRLGKAERKCV